MFDNDLIVLLPPIAAAFAGVVVFAWWIARVELPASRASRVRLDAANEQLREMRDEESQRARLLELNWVDPGTDPLDVVLAAGDDAAALADRLFARAAGGGAALRYDDEREHWTAVVSLFERGPTVAFAVDEVDRRCPFEALLAALEILVADAPPIVDGEHAASDVCVRFSDIDGRWQAYEPCDACGGGWLDMLFDRPDHAPLARLTAGRLPVDDEDGHEHGDRLGSPRCLHCAMR